ncbi:MAG: PAS domain-containing protein, partial [Planctomycetaceae bacterium]|nr:PAS domain-containing protein [Planctomycetaceae bacterium]
MFRLSARSQIAIGLTGIAVSALAAAIFLDFTPNWDRANREGRARLAETLAFTTSAFLSRGDADSLSGLVDAMVQRNPHLESVGVRHLDGELLLATAQHDTYWKGAPDGTSTEQYIQVPIFAGEQRFGRIELVFQPTRAAGLLGHFLNEWTLAMGFLSISCFATFSFYLARMLKQLDPSKAVPSHVRSALDSLTEGLLVLDRNERVVLANQSFSTMLNTPSEKLIGRKASEFPWELEESENWIPPWVLALQQQQPLANVMLQMRDADGAVRTFMVNCSPVLGTDGRYRGVLASFDDVTQLEQKKVELHSAKEAAESANRAKSEFLANMSHEIRTPMTAILGYADLLGGDEHNPRNREIATDAVQTIRNNANHLLAVINDILDMSKIEAGQLKVELIDTDVLQVTNEVATLLMPRARGKGIDFDVSFESPIPSKVKSDPTRLRQIL